MQVVWLRQELRLQDNTAIIQGGKEAIAGNQPLLLVLQWDFAEFSSGSPRRDYLLSAMERFLADCRAKQIPLMLLDGSEQDCLSELLFHFPAICKIHLNGWERGKGKIKDERIARYLTEKGVDHSFYLDHHLHSPAEILKENGEPYQVFTPYYRQWQARPKPQTQSLRRQEIPWLSSKQTIGKDQNATKKLDQLLRSRNACYDDQVGEDQAKDRLEEFCREDLADYAVDRDYPAKDTTSRLSPYLATGQCSIRQVYQQVLNQEDSPGRETFFKELAWREFYHMIYHFHPHQHNQEIIKKYRGLTWRRSEQDFNRWREGQTGFPIIDAAMNQLKQEGWLHNRLRMLVASFLTKDLMIDWRWGEAYFSQMLIDYDSASNIGGWQWAASVGTDACPYFRVFNPTVQSKKFDKEGAFIRKYVPVLAEVPEKYIHEPAKMPEKEREKIGLRLGTDYPLPMVDHKEQRQKVLDMFGV